MLLSPPCNIPPIACLIFVYCLSFLLDNNLDCFLRFLSGVLLFFFLKAPWNVVVWNRKIVKFSHRCSQGSKVSGPKFIS